MITIIQSDPQVPAGVFAAHLEQLGLPFRTIRIFAGDDLPHPAASRAVIVLGGNMGVNDEEQYPFLFPLKAFMRDVVEAGGFLLGICLGGQILADITGGQFTSGAHGEKGLCAVTLTAAAASDPLMFNLPGSFWAFQWHNDSFEPPPAACLLAVSSTCPGQAFRMHNAWGVQFHPEVDLEIVSDWCSRGVASQPLALAFAEVEPEHRAMARKLLDNFLVAAEIVPAS